MTFTLENTKEATHAAMCLAGSTGHQFYKNIADPSFELLSDLTSFSWEVIYNSPSYELIELFRPRNETREYWTTNGVTQYAQPQGNEMSTDNLIPISYVKKFTPLVVGDVLSYFNDGDPYDFTIADKNQACLYNGLQESDKYYFVVSFADRENTGKQPVGDDVMINTNWNFDKVLPASVVQWRIDNENESWKPNHAAMLKQWQAEVEAERPQELNEEYLKGCSRDHLLMFSIDMLAQTKYQQGVIDELTSAKYQAEQLNKGVHIDGDVDLAVGSEKVGVATKEDHHVSLQMNEQGLSKASEAIKDDFDKGILDCVKDISLGIGLEFGLSVGYANLADEVKDFIDCEINKATFDPTDKPVFTQAQSDAGELPPTGWVGEVCIDLSDMISTLRHWKIGDHIRCVVHVKNSSGLDTAVFQHLDLTTVSGLSPECFKPIQTDEDRLRDALSVIAIPKQVDQLLSSDKFTITLNKG